MANHRAGQRGIAHLALIAIIIIVVGVVGFAGYMVFKRNGASDAVATKAAEKVVQQAAKAQCAELKDDNLCKFFTSWKLHKQYNMTSTDTSGAKTVMEVDGDKSHIKVAGEQSYEMIVIGKSTYTKAGDTWYKQTAKDDKSVAATDVKPDFSEPSKDESGDDSKDQTTYKALGKEACGNLQCFKYQVIDPSASDEKQFMWFDDKDYQLRKMRTENAEGVSEQTFEYANVSIKEPSPVKELQPNQYVVPGSSEVMTMPSGVPTPDDMSAYQ